MEVGYADRIKRELAHLERTAVTKKQRIKALKRINEIKREYLQMMDEEKKENECIVQITERKCSDKIQPEIKVGRRYLIKNREKLADGTEVLVLLNWERSKTEKKVKTMRCNAKRFSWRTVTEEQAKEEFLKEEAKRGAAELLHGFNFEEHMQIAFVPLIIIHCAWAYCDKVLQMAAKLRISETKKLGRAVKELKQAYYDEMKKDLDYKHLKQVSDQAEEFMNTCAKDFMIMEFTIRGEILKVYPDDPYIDMRVYAFASVLLCDYYVKHSHECDKMIAARLHRRETQTMTNPKIDSLRTCMDAYTGTVEINLKQNVELCVRVFANNLKKINFTLDHEQRIGIQQ